MEISQDTRKDGRLSLHASGGQFREERNQRCFENKSIPFQRMKMNCLATFYFWCIQSVPKDIGGITLFLDGLKRI